MRIYSYVQLRQNRIKIYRNPRRISRNRQGFLKVVLNFGIIHGNAGETADKRRVVGEETAAAGIPEPEGTAALFRGIVAI
jgi:hypothetical protein